MGGHVAVSADAAPMFLLWLEKAPMMRWMKYFHKFAWGKSREADYALFDTESYREDDSKSVDQFIEDMDLCKEHAWSERYRGIDFEFVDKPDDVWLRHELENVEYSLRAYKQRQEMIQKLLNDSSQG